MFGLPKSTEMSKQLPKKSIYDKFNMNTVEKEKIDSDISRITIINEISQINVNIPEGAKVKNFFVLLVLLKRKNYNNQTITTLSRIMPQYVLFALKYEDEVKLAVYNTKLIQTQWIPIENASIQLKGLNLDAAWENIVCQIGGIEIENGHTLEQQIELEIEQERINKEIARLEKLARTEKQPRKKFELVQEIKHLKKEWNNIYDKKN